MNRRTLFFLCLGVVVCVLLYTFSFSGTRSKTSGGNGSSWLSPGTPSPQEPRDWEQELFGDDPILSPSAPSSHDAHEQHAGHHGDHSHHQTHQDDAAPSAGPDAAEFDLDLDLAPATPSTGSSGSSSSSGGGSGASHPAKADGANPRCARVTNFAIVTVALGPYYVFVYPFVASVERFVFADDPCVNITVAVWTDRVRDTQWHQVSAQSRISVVLAHLPLEPFPAASMKRFAAYLNLEWLLRKQDYILHQDIDSEFIAAVGREYFVPEGMFAVAHADNYHYDGTEIVGNRDGKFITMADVGVKREGRGRFFNQACVFEPRPHVCVQSPPYDGNHNARLPPGSETYYFYGGIWGGDATKTIEAFRTVASWISTDLYVFLVVRVIGG